MLVTKPYDRENAYRYAQRWAMSRNPLFYSFTGIGGDCTNFVSQCVYAGSCTMNYTPVFGWYYVSSYDRTASWTGVEYFYNFITRAEESEGPFGREVGAGGLELGDVVQLGDYTGDFYHTLVVTGFYHGTYLVSAHSYDALNRRLDSYTYSQARFLHIDGVRTQQEASTSRCFERLLNGIGL